MNGLIAAYNWIVKNLGEISSAVAYKLKKINPIKLKLSLSLHLK